MPQRGREQDQCASGVCINSPNRFKSTLPPLMITPTRLPASAWPASQAAAKPRQPVGSTTIFMRSAKRRIAVTSCASLTVSTSSTSRHSEKNFEQPRRSAEKLHFSLPSSDFFHARPFCCRYILKKILLKNLRYDQVSFRNNLRLDSQIVRCEVGPESETNPMPQASLFF